MSQIYKTTTTRLRHKTNMKNSIIKLILVLCFISGISAVAFGQENNPTVAQIEAMKKLDFLVGNWQGSGWMLIPGGKRETFQINESVQMKLGGLVLLVEGLGKSKDDKTGADRIVHNALATLSFDPREKLYRWRTFTMQGNSADTIAQIGDKSFIWGFKNPQAGDIRYTITLNEKGNWFEIGEFSRDGGKTWTKFFEMELQKIK